MKKPTYENKTYLKMHSDATFLLQQDYDQVREDDEKNNNSDNLTTARLRNVVASIKSQIKFTMDQLDKAPADGELPIPPNTIEATLNRVDSIYTIKTAYEVKESFISRIGSLLNNNNKTLLPSQQSNVKKIILEVLTNMDKNMNGNIKSTDAKEFLQAVYDIYDSFYKKLNTHITY